MRAVKGFTVVIPPSRGHRGIFLIDRPVLNLSYGTEIRSEYGTY